MNDNLECGPRRPSPRRARAAATIIVLAGVVLLTVACGGSPSSTAGVSAQHTQELAYAQCMRSHGVPSFPDPDSQGQFPPLQVGRNDVSQQSVQAAQDACRHLQPGGGSGQGTAQQQQAAQRQALNFSRCMRAHGVPNFPDPAVTNGGFGYSLAGVDTGSPHYQAAQRACQSPAGSRR